MNADYFDMLLARMRGEMPAVEPRIFPSTAPQTYTSDSYEFMDTHVEDMDEVKPKISSGSRGHASEQQYQQLDEQLSYRPSDVVVKSHEIQRIENTVELINVREVERTSQVQKQASHNDSIAVSKPVAKSQVHVEASLSDQEQPSFPTQDQSKLVPKSDRKEASPAVTPSGPGRGSVAVTPTVRVISEVGSSPERKQGAAPPDFPPAPISIRIERIDVHSTSPSAGKDYKGPSRSPTGGPRFTLDEYLKRRNRGRW